MGGCIIGVLWLLYVVYASCCAYLCSLLKWWCLCLVGVAMLQVVSAVILWWCYYCGCCYLVVCVVLL